MAVACFLWGPDVDFDSDGNSKIPNDTFWTELTVETRTVPTERVDIDPMIEDPLILQIKGSTEIIAARTAFYLAETTYGEISETASGPWRSSRYLESNIDYLGRVLRLPPEKPVGEVLATIGGGVDETSVSLRFFGDDLDPNELSRLLGSKPTLSGRKGDIRRTKVYDYIEKRGKWILSLEHRHSSQATLEEIINEIFDQLTDELSVWKLLHEKYKGDLFCGLWLEEWNRGFGLSSSVTRRIAERYLSIDFDIYFDADGDEEEVT